MFAQHIHPSYANNCRSSYIYQWVVNRMYAVLTFRPSREDSGVCSPLIAATIVAEKTDMRIIPTVIHTNPNSLPLRERGVLSPYLENMGDLEYIKKLFFRILKLHISASLTLQLSW